MKFNTYDDGFFHVISGEGIDWNTVIVICYVIDY
jgi:hypothetical protein